MPKIISRSHVLGLSLTLALMSSATVAVAASGAAEVYTATNHAVLAVHATDIKMVHSHLHHVVNCLVGPGGAGFDANEMNPCAGGKGAINDWVGASPERVKFMQTAVAQSLKGINQSNLAKAQSLALDALHSLESVRSH